MRPALLATHAFGQPLLALTVALKVLMFKLDPRALLALPAAAASGSGSAAEGRPYARRRLWDRRRKWTFSYSCHLRDADRTP